MLRNMWAWIYALLIALQPEAPWRDSYAATAYAIDEVAHESPLYGGDDGVAETVAEIVAVGWFESRFDPHAVGDHGRSIGFGQIGVSNLGELRLESSRDLHDIRTNLRAMVTILRASHRTCRGLPRDKQLAAYATGRGMCTVPEGVRASIHRSHLATGLLENHPPFWRDASEGVFSRP